MVATLKIKQMRTETMYVQIKQSVFMDSKKSPEKNRQRSVATLKKKSRRELAIKGANWGFYN